MEDRKKTNLKILKIIGIVFGSFILLGIFSRITNKDKETLTSVTEKPFNMDSLISEVKKDKDFEIKEVYYNKKDSSFNIAITNKGNVIKKHDYSAKYFNTMFFLDSVPKIEGIYLYEYVKGKSLEKKDYGNQLDAYGQRTARYRDKFDKKHFNDFSGYYKPVRTYLKENVNDPSSLEIVNTWNLGMNKDSTFAIKTTYRAKNSFNAIVLETIYCNIDMEGKLSEIRTE